MLAAVFRSYGPPDVLEWSEVPDPEVEGDTVVVEVHACGVNRSDLPSREGTAKWELPLPWILGAEPAGRVATVGPDVQSVAVGDWVAALQQYETGDELTVLGSSRWGGYGELVAVPERAIEPL